MTEDDGHVFKTASKTGVLSSLRLPTTEERATITKVFGLDRVKEEILFRAVLAAIQDLQIDEAIRNQRPDKVKSLIALAAAVKRFRKALDEISGKVDLGDIMPIALLEELGGMATFNTLQELLPRKRSKGMIAIANQKYKSADGTITIQTIEDLTLDDRKTLGLLCGDEVLRKVIDLTDEAIQHWASEVSANKNGRPRAFERDFMIECLAAVCPDVLGMRPLASKVGRFIDLCRLVLESCGFEEDGIEKAVYRLVARMKVEVGGDPRNHP